MISYSERHPSFPTRNLLTILIVTIFRWILRLLPVAFGIIGWHFGHWFGMAAGVCGGAVLAVIIWCYGYIQAFRWRLLRRRGEMAKLSTEDLRRIAVDPTASEMAFAMEELSKRGEKVRPSLESLFDLLESPLSNRRVLGMSLLFGLYPAVHAKIPKGASSSDPPEVWRSRLAALRGNETGTGT